MTEESVNYAVEGKLPIIETVAFQVRLPKPLWKLASLDKIEGREKSINDLIVRLLAEHYSNK